MPPLETSARTGRRAQRLFEPSHCGEDCPSAQERLAHSRQVEASCAPGTPNLALFGHERLAMTEPASDLAQGGSAPTPWLHQPSVTGPLEISLAGPGR